MPEVALGYDFFIQGMAYLSFAIVVGVKCLGVFSHGPETKSLVHKATVNETIFESALQLSLVARIFFSSGYGTWASALSAASSLASIGNVQVQTFLRRHKEKVSKASFLGENLRCDLDSSRLRPLRHFQAWLDHFGPPLERHPLCREYSIGNWASCPRFLHHGDPYQRPGGS